MRKATFEQWLKQVDEFVKAKTYLCVSDLPDCPYRAWYEGGKTAKGAANAAIKAAGE